MKPGMMELLVILAVVVIVFGPTQIPKLAKMFGKSVKNFREASAAADKEDGKDDAETAEE